MCFHCVTRTRHQEMAWMYHLSASKSSTLSQIKSIYHIKTFSSKTEIFNNSYYNNSIVKNNHHIPYLIRQPLLQPNLNQPPSNCHLPSVLHLDVLHSQSAMQTSCRIIKINWKETCPPRKLCWNQTKSNDPPKRNPLPPHPQNIWLPKPHLFNVLNGRLYKCTVFLWILMIIQGVASLTIKSTTNL